MSELDRRIAVEVMGEPEPPVPEKDIRPYRTEGWIIIADEDYVLSWVPLRFSSDLEHAMRAVDRYFEGITFDRSNVGYHLQMHYDWGVGHLSTETPWHVFFNHEEGVGQTLPEAICNLLLALKEEK